MGHALIPVATLAATAMHAATLACPTLDFRPVVKTHIEQCGPTKASALPRNAYIAGCYDTTTDTITVARRAAHDRTNLMHEAIHRQLFRAGDSQWFDERKVRRLTRDCLAWPASP